MAINPMAYSSKDVVLDVVRTDDGVDHDDNNQFAVSNSVNKIAPRTV